MTNFLWNPMVAGHHDLAHSQSFLVIFFNRFLQLIKVHISGIESNHCKLYEN